MSVCAVLLAGGASRRMGFNKALLPWHGGTLLDYLAGELDFFPEKLLSAQQEFPLPGSDWILVPDLVPGCGPMGALQSVLPCMKADAALFAACDLPFFTRELAQSMVQAYEPDTDCLICRDETGRVHPVCAIYHRRILPKVITQLQTGDFRMMHLLCRISVSCFPVASEQMQNANTPEIWQKIQTASPQR